MSISYKQCTVSKQCTVLALTILLGSSVASAQQEQQPAGEHGSNEPAGERGTAEPPGERGATDSPALDHTELADVTLRTDKTDRISRIGSKFRGSIFLLDQSITPDTINPGAQLSPVPSYQWWMSFRPRYYFRHDLSLRVRLDLTIEWLNGGAETTLKRQAILGDLWIDFAYNPKPLKGIISTFSVRSIFPTSLDSQSNTTVMKSGLVANFTRPFKTRIGEFEPQLGAYALYNFVQNTAAGVQGDGYSCTTTDYTPALCSQSTGRMNEQVSLTAVLGLRYNPIEKLGINLNYILVNKWAYQTPDVTITDATGGSATIPHSDGDTRFRQSGWFLASLDYDPVSYVSLSLGYYSLRPTRDPDGSIGNPFYKPGGDSRVFFSTTFNLDKVYETIARHGKKAPAPMASSNAVTRPKL